MQNFFFFYKNIIFFLVPWNQISDSTPGYMYMPLISYTKKKYKHLLTWSSISFPLLLHFLHIFFFSIMSLKYHIHYFVSITFCLLSLFNEIEIDHYYTNVCLYIEKYFFLNYILKC